MNFVRTAMLIAALTAIFMGVGYLIGGSGGMLTAFLVAAAMNFFAYWNADKLVLSMHRAREVDARTAPEFYALVRELAAKAGLPMPRVYVVDNPQPNAFATGRNPEHAAVAATTGLLQSLSREEVAAVIAHELGHIKNRDTLIMTVTATIAGAVSMLANFAFFFGGSRDNNNPLGLIGGHRRGAGRAARRAPRPDGGEPDARIFGRPGGRGDHRQAGMARRSARQAFARGPVDPQRHRRTQSGDRAPVHRQSAFRRPHGQPVLDPSFDREPDRRPA